jgi:RNA polymerase sigma-70 factor (ECF subfamily)
MTHHEPDTEELLAAVNAGDVAAREQVLVRHKDRLRRMLAVRMDRRLAARVDPSDVLQEALLEAHRKLSDYIRRRPLPFYPWLRQLAWERLVQLHRQHLHAGRRSVTREEGSLPLPDESAWDLARRLPAGQSSPSGGAVRAEVLDRVREALAALSERDREVLVLRYLEQLSTAEIAAVLGINEGAVRVRHTRALERLRGLLADDFGEAEP